MYRTGETSKEQAQHLIADELRAAETRKAGADCDLYAERLLARLEPVIFEHAPPPARIVQALRYGNQAPGPARA